jgi:hypothetical protein
MTMFNPRSCRLSVFFPSGAFKRPAAVIVMKRGINAQYIEPVSSEQTDRAHPSPPPARIEKRVLNGPPDFQIGRSWHDAFTCTSIGSQHPCHAARHP